jgi:hypothetical protein
MSSVAGASASAIASGATGVHGALTDSDWKISSTEEDSVGSARRPARPASRLGVATEAGTAAAAAWAAAATLRLSVMWLRPRTGIE